MARQEDIETCFIYCEHDKAFFSSNERKWITRIHKLKEKHPDKITILKEPEDNDGTIYCKLPPSALKVVINTRTGRALTEEQLQRMAEGRRRSLQNNAEQQH